MTELEYRAHLARQMLSLMRLPLRSTHEPTGIPVWQLNCIVIDAFERVLDGKWG